jgi:dihydrofolate reductase
MNEKNLISKPKKIGLFSQDKPKISLISAIDRQSRTIGKEGGGLPWRIPEDFKYFKEKTMGHPIIMGRTTWEEFNNKPLPSRHHIVITHQNNYEVSPENLDKVSIVTSIDEAIDLAIKSESENKNFYEKDHKEPEIFIIGGSQIYEIALPFADRLYLTLVDANIDGPKKFPDYEAAGFSKIISSQKSQDENFTYEFIILEK